jgi:hypothetical protein
LKSKSIPPYCVADAVKFVTAGNVCNNDAEADINE